MRIIIFILLSFIFFTSCKTRNKIVEKKLLNCTNKTYNKYLLDGFGIKGEDYYKHITLIEDIFIKEGILKGNKKENYLTLIKKINSIKKEKAIKIINRINFSFENLNLPKFNNYIFSSGIFNCPYKILKDGDIKLTHPIKTIAYSYSNFEAYGFNNQKNLNKMFSQVNKEDFSKIVYRSYYILVVYTNFLEKMESTNKN